MQMFDPEMSVRNLKSLEQKVGLASLTSPLVHYTLKAILKLVLPESSNVHGIIYQEPNGIITTKSNLEANN